MNSNKDKAIKRYLKSISGKVQESNIYKSIHYYTNDKIHIRFADHFSFRATDVDINIIKCDDNTYLVCVKGIQQTVNRENVLEYVKASVLIYPTFKGIAEQFLKPVTKLEQERNELKNKVKKLESNNDAISKLQAKIKQLEQDVMTARQEKNKIKEKLKSIRTYITNV